MPAIEFSADLATFDRTRLEANSKERFTETIRYLRHLEGFDFRRTVKLVSTAKIWGMSDEEVDEYLLAGDECLCSHVIFILMGTQVALSMEDIDRATDTPTSRSIPPRKRRTARASKSSHD